MQLFPTSNIVNNMLKGLQLPVAQQAMYSPLNLPRVTMKIADLVYRMLPVLRGQKQQGPWKKWVTRWSSRSEGVTHSQSSFMGL
jgi:hypothetical protein